MKIKREIRRGENKILYKQYRINSQVVDGVVLEIQNASLHSEVRILFNPFFGILKATK